jgi:hypothetical protein
MAKYLNTYVPLHWLMEGRGMELGIFSKKKGGGANVITNPNTHGFPERGTNTNRVAAYRVPYSAFPVHVQRYCRRLLSVSFFWCPQYPHLPPPPPRPHRPRLFPVSLFCARSTSMYHHPLLTSPRGPSEAAQLPVCHKPVFAVPGVAALAAITYISPSLDLISLWG